MKSAASKKPIRPRRPTAVIAPREQYAGLAVLSELLAGHGLRADRKASPLFIVGPSGKRIALPASVREVLERSTKALSRGSAVTIVSVDRDLTTQQAADILNVSRQYLVQLLDQGKIPHSKTGAHRRIRMADLLAFRKLRDHRRKAALDEITRLGQEMGGYFDPPFTR